jgi:EmrB/QacA subfamily drug resistance transporter
MSDMTVGAGAAPALSNGGTSTAAPSNWRRLVGLAVMLTGTFMALMDVFIVNVAIPSIRRSLGASFAQVEFVVAGYGLTYALALITSGRLGDIFGRRRMFMIGLAAFVATSALCGMAPSAPLLVYARLAQGLAAAVLFPQVFSLIRVEFTDPRQRRMAFSAMGLVIGMAVVVGQVLGGFLVNANLWGLQWRPVFLINIPMGAFALIAAPYFIKESVSPEGRKIDVSGIALSALGLGLLLYPLIQGRELGWPAWSLTMLALSAPALAAFAYHQHRKTRLGQSPLLDTSLFADRSFVLGMLAVLLFYSTLNSTYLALTLLLQIGLHRTAFQAGLILATNASAFMVTSIVAGRLPPSWSRRVLIVGAVVTTLSGLAAAGIAWSVRPLWGEALIPALLIRGVGQGLLMTPLLNAILSRVDERRAGAASGLVSTMQQVGGALGVAIVGIIFFSAIGHARAAGAGDAQAYGWGFVLASLYGAAGLAVTAMLLKLLPRSEAETRA